MTDPETRSALFDGLVEAIKSASPDALSDPESNYEAVRALVITAGCLLRAAQPRDLDALVKATFRSFVKAAYFHPLDHTPEQIDEEVRRLVALWHRPH